MNEKREKQAPSPPRRKSTMASDYLQAPAKPISQADSCQIISGAIFLNCTIRSRLSA